MQDVSIVATASILPETVVTNRDIGQRLIDGAHARNVRDAGAEETARVRSELIEQKTGLRARHFFAPEDMPVDIGTTLLEKLMDDSGWATLDAVIVSSSSTQGFPGLSQQIVVAAREKHGALAHPFVLDISSNACTSFMYGLTIGKSLIQAMGFRRVACLAIEFSSRCIAYDPKAFGISTLFGDAAAGVLLEGGEKGIALLKTTRASSMVDPGTIGLIKGSGMQANDPAREVPEEQRWFMAGPPVAVGATRILVDEIRRVQGDGHTIDWLIPHQANLTRILIPACKSAGIDPKRLCASFTETGNTSSASIPLLLDQLVRDGRTAKGENALLIGFGASFSVGSALLTFQ
ncbi:MAG: 3-oxoacyl-[acyl-carrier-protein] synthase III C-terminal domain-containing protein [Alphaproteobacteria bacterium]|nr:3-oxoacyl-[acyl-carrier-protein] synthase III C-terminal domain-containing protein [Alphaproteobacteria bacterium]